MAYSDFSLASIKKSLNLTISPRQDLFSAVPALECSNYLTETLAYKVPFALASNTEKSRSEMIIAPIWLELTRQFNEREGNEVSSIYGAVTTGEIWKFLRLEGQSVQIDLLE
jgi:hypothetical protein